eukprot:CAMPEP_0182533578 /NCGR_PEP_ID=MMETSP1323-20130603/13902_1 /TAXON_ID=236787 /ORGANISM="Florenciella parvula, Strain RCC1693" /LENGTH=114 /DNA_ID=CAMNT_0024743481 /DNA_START=149 /DNA_END=489 /DNA_ORIENTATION=+
MSSSRRTALSFDAASPRSSPLKSSASTTSKTSTFALAAGDPPDEPLELGLQRGLNHARYDARAEVPQPAEPPRLVRILRVVQRHVQAVDVRQVTEVEATRRRRGREEYSGRRRR